MHDQKTLPLHTRTMREYAAKRGWEIAVQIREVGSGAVERELREKLMAVARRREIDVVLVATGSLGPLTRRSGGYSQRGVRARRGFPVAH